MAHKSQQKKLLNNNFHPGDDWTRASYARLEVSQKSYAVPTPPNTHAIKRVLENTENRDSVWLAEAGLNTKERVDRERMGPIDTSTLTVRLYFRNCVRWY